MPPRYYWKFANPTGDVEVVFPRFNAEFDQEQPLGSRFETLAGGSYGYDLTGVGPAVKANAEVRLRFLVIGEEYGPTDAAADADEQVEYISETCYSIGRGKLWQAGGTGERWAWARLKEMASLRLSVVNRYHVPVVLSFVRMSDWQEGGS